MRKLIVVGVLSLLAEITQASPVETYLAGSKILTDETTETYANIAVPTGFNGNIVVWVETYTTVTDGTEFQSVGNQIECAASNKNGTPDVTTFYTSSFAKMAAPGTLTQFGSNATSSGTLSLTWLANTSLSAATITLHYKIRVVSPAGVTITPN